MECDTVLAQLTALLDDELTQADVRAMETHLASCPNCASEFAAIKLLYQQAGSWKTLEESDETDLWPVLEMTLLREEITLLQEANGRMQAENARLRSELAALRQQATASRPLTTPVLFPTEAAPPNPKVWL